MDQQQSIRHQISEVDSAEELENAALLLQYIYLPLESKIELTSTLQKFSSNLRSIAKQVKGSKPLPVPNIPLERTSEEILNNKDYVEKIDTHLEAWTLEIKDNLNQIEAREKNNVQIKSAVDEIEK